MTGTSWGLALALPAALGLAWAGLRGPVPVAVFQGLASWGLASRGLASRGLASQETGSQRPGLSPAAPQVCQSGRTVADNVEWSGSAARLDATFWSSGLLRLQVCGPGTVSFTASGTAAQGQDAVLSASLGASVLLETPVRQPRFFRLRVSGPGWLSFGFPNDLYRPPEDRNLFLRGLRFTPDGRTPDK